MPNSQQRGPDSNLSESISPGIYNCVLNHLLMEECISDMCVGIGFKFLIKMRLSFKVVGENFSAYTSLFGKSCTDLQIDHGMG